MAIKKYKPTSNGRRNMTSSDFQKSQRRRQKRACWNQSQTQVPVILMDT
ncbi:Uncharacterised protein [Weissella viridescens]|uniref:Uncharacterized protein n=1 Tax=Weissella viridescens TaxID=1629 RepID=A0A380NX93_WEIVI|nr:Uncharacterised protein [Weissella viridescens]